MDYFEAKLVLDHSVALRLLKGDNAALCLGFLHSVFRSERAVWRPLSEMVSRLTTVLEEISEENGVRRFPRPAKDYLDQWIINGALYTRYNDENELV